ncbi:MAG: hypothetical protein WCT40_03700 [Candidatus Magasanikbacteria bacterium]
MTNGENGLTVNLQISGHTVDNKTIPAWEYLVWLLFARMRVKGILTAYLSKVAKGTPHQKGIKLMSSTGRKIRLRVQPWENESCWEMVLTLPSYITNVELFKNQLIKKAEKISLELRQKSRRVRKAKEESPANDFAHALLPGSSDEQQPEQQEEKMDRIQAPTKKPRFDGWDVAVELLKEHFGGRDFRSSDVTAEIAEQIGVPHHNLLTTINGRAKAGKGLAVVPETNEDGTPKKRVLLYRWIATSEAAETPAKPVKKRGRPCRTDLRVANAEPTEAFDAPQSNTPHPPTRVEQCRASLRQIADQTNRLEARKSELATERDRINIQLAVLADEDKREREELDRALVEETRNLFGQFLETLPPEVRDRKDLAHILTIPPPPKPFVAILVPGRRPDRLDDEITPPRDDDSF